MQKPEILDWRQIGEYIYNLVDEHDRTVGQVVSNDLFEWTVYTFLDEQNPGIPVFISNVQGLSNAKRCMVGVITGHLTREKS
jgi:hypothetical protein